MRRICLVAIFMVGSTAALAQTADTSQQLDLVCVGSKTAGNASEHVSITYRLDLEKRVYCTDACDGGPVAMKIIEPNRVVFQDTKTARAAMLETMDRTTGVLTQSVEYFSKAMKSRSYSIKAVCKRAPFSGFPATKP